MRRARSGACVALGGGGDGSDGGPPGARRPRWPPWLRPWACNRLSGPAGRSSLWAGPWRSLGRVPPPPGCWAGPVGGPSVRRRYGGGGKRLVHGRWSPSRNTCTRWRTATCRRRRRWWPTSPPLPWGWAPLGCWARVDRQAASPPGRHAGVSGHGGVKGANLATVESEADRANIVVRASVLMAQRITSFAWKSMLGGIGRPSA